MRESTILNEAYHKYLREVNGCTMPDHTLPKFKLSTKNPERQIKQKIEKYLGWIGHYCVIVDSSAHYSKEVGRYIKSETSPGCPGLIASINGQFVGIEVKRIYENGRDRQSDIQKKVEARIIHDGGKYWIVSDFISFWKRLNDELYSG